MATEWTPHLISLATMLLGASCVWAARKRSDSEVGRDLKIFGWILIFAGVASAFALFVETLLPLTIILAMLSVILWPGLILLASRRLTTQLDVRRDLTILGRILFCAGLVVVMPFALFAFAWALQGFRME